MSIRSFILCTAIASGLVSVAAPAMALSLIEPIGFANWRTDSDDWSAGVGLACGIGSLEIVPSAEYVFVDHATDYAVNIDGHIPIIPLGIAALYIGGGWGHYWHDPDVGEKDNEDGFDVLAGVKINLTRFKPFGEFKYTTAGPDNPVLTLGFRLSLGD